MRHCFFLYHAKNTFEYGSTNWTDRETIHPETWIHFNDHLNSNYDIKLATYWSTTLNQICIRVPSLPSILIQIPFRASSLESLIRDGQTRLTNTSAATWKRFAPAFDTTVLGNSSCSGLAGFNVGDKNSIRARFGIVTAEDQAGCGNRIDGYVGDGFIIPERFSIYVRVSGGDVGGAGDDGGDGDVGVGVGDGGGTAGGPGAPGRSRGGFKSGGRCGGMVEVEEEVIEELEAEVKMEVVVNVIVEVEVVVVAELEFVEEVEENLEEQVQVDVKMKVELEVDVERKIGNRSRYRGKSGGEARGSVRGECIRGGRGGGGCRSSCRGAVADAVGGIGRD